MVNASLKSSSSTASGATCSSTMLSVTIPSQESKSGHFVTKNVPLRNDSAKVKDVCAVLAHMLAIPNPIDYTLFSIVDGKGIGLSIGTMVPKYRIDFFVLKLDWCLFSKLLQRIFIMLPLFALN